VKVKIADRDEYFYNKWKTVFIHFEGVRKPAEVNVNKSSFWNDTCHELINQDIGKWLLDNGLAPWPENQPPKLELIRIKDNHFKMLKHNKSNKSFVTTVPGYLNDNGQKNLGKRQPPLEGTDNYQYVYVMNCTKCGLIYGANGSDIHLRKCPNCQEGKLGLELLPNEKII